MLIVTNKYKDSGNEYSHSVTGWVEVNKYYDDEDIVVVKVDRD